MAARLEAEKFTGKNDFGLWRMKMRAMLIQQGLSAALESEKEAAAGDLDEKAAAKRAEIAAKAHSVVVLCLGDKVLREVAKETTAAGILKKLESLYLTKSLANRLYMKQRLYSYRFLEDKGVFEQLEDFNKAIDDLENIDVTIADEDKAILLLNALPRSYDHLRDAIMYGREGTITLLEVQSALRAKELQNSGSRSVDPASESLNVKGFKGKKQFKKKFDAPKPSGSSNEQKETRVCFWCKKPGHLKKDCFGWKKKQVNSGNQGPNTSDCVESADAAEALNVMETIDGASWIMDSGYSFHICPNLEWFEVLSDLSGTVILGNNQVCSIKGIGSIRLRMQNQSVKILNDVRYIPEVKRNLISLGSLEKKGCCFSSSDGKMLVKKGGNVVMTAERRGSLYYLYASVIKVRDDELNLVKSASLRIWHERLGHPAMGSIRELAKKEIISANDAEELPPCQDCIRGKAKKLPYPTGKHNSSSPLEYVHSDLWGPASENTIGGGKYYMSLIDDFSRKTWIYILKAKSDAFGKFKAWCNEVELEKGCKVKCLRTDNGLEYLSREFDDFCKNKGIKRHRTVPLNPQQNGVAERANRTIIERVRCMLFSSGLGKRFWGEAASTAVYLMNKCPSSSIGGDTPDFRWFGRHSDYSGLKTFGCKAFAHVKQGKLDPRALMCVMLGYQKGVKGYRLWSIEPGNHRVIVSRDVIFLENEMPYVTKAGSDGVRVTANDSNDFEVEPEEGGVGSSKSSSSEDEIETPLSGVDQQAGEDLRNYQLARDRAKRVSKLPARFSDSEMVFYALLAAEEVELEEPLTYKEAMQSKDKESWLQAMNEEIASLLKNKTWTLVEKVEGRKLVSCKWIFKRKLEADGSIRFKARLVARGFSQEHGIDYNEVFSPVVKHSSIRMLMAIVARNEWELEQMDVKTAFLNGDLEETIYMVQPEGFAEYGKEMMVCKLNKSLYGLKQASRQWHKKFNSHMLKCGFIRSKYKSIRNRSASTG